MPSSCGRNLEPSFRGLSQFVRTTVDGREPVTRTVEQESQVDAEPAEETTNGRQIDEPTVQHKGVNSP